MKSPVTEINFEQKATTLPERSERGYAILIMRDDTSALFNYKMYKDITEVEEDTDMYSKENLQYIKDAFEFGTYRVVVVKIGEDKDANPISGAFKIVQNNIYTGWITICDGIAEDYSTLTSWTKSKEKEKKTYKAVVYKVNTTDSMHVVNFINEHITFSDGDRGEQTGEKYLPSLAGIFASCNVLKGCVNYKCTNLASVEEVEDNDTEIEKGNFVLYNDKDYVRIVTDVNSLQSINGSTLTEDMKSIEVVEALDLIRDDITEVFKETYQSNFKNGYDDQILFISAINGYFDELAESKVLDKDYENKSDVNVEKQKKIWISSGKSEAANWDDSTVKRKTYKRNVYLSGDIKVLQSMVNLYFDISLF
ncbi:phage tail sheath C-terminal domain-containing protein [Clostridium butyricum]|uniref:Tail sheath protein C-terminal domain-containing protein n=1 Tax=Clostridium butyricum E4 str. BoNT E BL5262 TaxID=632245 RepID=C4IGR6_CLOBU|nr:phage tail sheath C-terminal domain-containing protein [Clostridium butyricum]EDT74719.1 hypothetical protein CBY_2547 [Clostridium butyricum 5521]EEP54022.1 conserved hypothetical protein [Clostridium butyricum E4 str. BoNT E BL5262]NFL30484.1 phage tail protein [Clostridium butyricum]NFS19439.1 phage tail protein [Clostridium butyricum]